jgi:hypothetical protein
VVGSGNRGVAIQNLTGSFSVLGNDGAVTPQGGSISGFGGNGMDFRNVALCATVGSCSGSSVILNNVNASGNGISETVAGASPNCGGDIVAGNNLQCVANLYLQNVDGVSITTSTFDNGGQIGINGNNVYDFTLNGSSVQGNGNAAAESGILFQNLHGTATFGSVTVKNNAASQVVVGMTNAGAPASPLAILVSGGDFASTAPGANRSSGFVLTGTAAGSTGLSISSSQFANNAPAAASTSPPAPRAQASTSTARSTPARSRRRPTA